MRQVLKAVQIRIYQLTIFYTCICCFTTQHCLIIIYYQMIDYPLICPSSLLSQNDRAKAQKAMEATWNTMEKKEKIMWIKKAAEDQKRYEVSPDIFKHFVALKLNCLE